MSYDSSDSDVSGSVRYTVSSDEETYGSSCSGSSAADKVELDGGYIDTSGSHSPMKRLFSFLRPFRVTLVAAMVSSVLNKVLDLMPPLLTKWMVDTVEGRPPSWLVTLAGESGDGHPEPGKWNLPLAIGILAIVIFFFESLFQYFYELLFKDLSQKVQHEARMTSYGSMQEREIAFFERHRTGDLLSLVNDDVNVLERFLNTGINEILQYVVVFGFAGAVMFVVSWRLTLIAITPAPFIWVGSRVFQKVIQPRYATVRSKVGEMSARLENNLSGVMVIKSFTAETFEYERVNQVSAAYRDANFSAIKVAALYIPVIRMAISIGFGAVLTVGSYWVINNNQHGLSVSDLVLFAMLSQRVLWPITRLGQTIDEFLRARAAARRVFALVDTDPEIKDTDSPVLFTPGRTSKARRKAQRKGKTTERARGSISFDKVKFKYQAAGPMILKGLSFDVSPGETIGIAGATGAGKSTLIKLLLRLYEVGGGSVSVDGVDVRELPLQVLRSNVALVSQDTYLFHGSILENIAYGLPMSKALRKQVVRAAKDAELHEFVAGLPDGYDTIVGERGVRLSGGQRQRLSIARALLKDAPILLLDESTASVDSETEAAIQRNLRRLTQGKTALIIAHRLSTLRQADRILVLENGKVVEEDTHDALVEAGGTYAHLWNVQIGELFDEQSSSSSSKSSKSSKSSST